MSSYVKDNYELYGDMAHGLNQLFERSKVAAIVPRIFASYFEVTTNQKIFCFDETESFKSARRSMRLSNSFLSNKMNSFIRQAMETGHLLKWASVERKIDETKWNGPVVLAVEHFSGITLVYVIGITISVVAFIGERLVNKKLGTSNNRIWMWLDKWFISPERIVFRGDAQPKCLDTRLGDITSAVSDGNE